MGFNVILCGEYPLIVIHNGMNVDYPLVVYQSSLLKMAIDMADLPIKNGHVP